MMKKIDLSRLHEKFRYLVEIYMNKHGLNQGQIANMLNVQRSHFNALLHGKSDRPLTAYYLFKFISSGIIKVSENEDEVEGLSQRETDFWEFSKKKAEGISLLQKIAKLRSRGVNIEPIIDSLLQ